MVLLVRGEGRPTSVYAVIASVQHIVQSSRWAWHTSPPIRNPKQNGMSGYFREIFYIIPVLRIRDVYPGSWILIFTHPGSRISDPITATKERGEKKFVVIPFYVAKNFTKLEIILVLKCRRKKFGPIFKFFSNFLPKKLSLGSQKYGFGIRDPGSGKNLFRIPDPGVKKAPDPQHCIIQV
jgi:hypothetical protein